MAGRPQVPSQNLINQNKASGIGSKPGLYKAIALDALSIATALFVSYAYFAYLTSGLSAWFLLTALLLFATCSALQAFLTKNATRRSLVILGEALALVIFFVRSDEWQILLSAFVILALILLWGYFAGRSRVRSSIEVQFFGTTYTVIGKVTTAILLFLMLVYVPQVGGALIPRDSFKTLFDWSTNFLNDFYPNVPFNDSFANFSEGIAKMELNGNPAFQALPASDQATAVSQASGAIAASVAQATGITPGSTEQVSDVVYDYIATAFGNWQNHLDDRFILIWMIALFLVLRTIGIVFVWAAQFIALIFYEILLASGFMHISQSPQTKENLEY